MARYLTRRKLLGYAILTVAFALVAIGVGSGDGTLWQPHYAVLIVGLGVVTAYSKRSAGLYAVAYGAAASLSTLALVLGLDVASSIVRPVENPWLADWTVPLVALGATLVVAAAPFLAEERWHRYFDAGIVASVFLFQFGILAVSIGSPWSAAILIPGAIALLLSVLILRELGRLPGQKSAR